MSPCLVRARPFRPRRLLPLLAAFVAACSDAAPDGVRIPTTGGTLTADSTRVSIVIPSGALSNDTHIDVRRGAAPNDPTLVGDRSYEIAPEGLRLAAPATVIIRPAGTLPTGVARDELAVAVSVDGVVREIPATADGAAGTVTAQLSTLGDLWVRRQHVAGVSLDRASAQLDVGRTLQLRATARASQGRTLQSPTIVWSSDNQGVALVGPETGLVSAMTPGTARITARSEGREVQATITVVRRTVREIVLAAGQSTLFPGQTTSITAVLRDSVGDPIERMPTWVSRTPEIATVTAAGVVTAVAPGIATIDASADGAFGSATIVVRPTPVRVVGVRSLTTGEPMPLGALSGTAVVDVSVNPQRTASLVALTLTCPGREAFVIATHPLSTAAGLDFSFAFPTDAFDPATGVVRTPNGACALQTRLDYPTGPADTGVPVPVTLANTSRLVAQYTITDTRTAVLGISPATRATNVDDGFERRAGAVTLRLLALAYAPDARVLTIDGSFLGRTFAGIAPQAGTQHFVLDFRNEPPSAELPLGIAGHTSPVGGEIPIVSAMTVSSGPAFTTVEATALRIDNAAPRAPATFTLAGAQTVGGTPWVPGDYIFGRAQVFATRGDTVGGVNGTTVVFYGQRAAQAGLADGVGFGAACAQGTLVKAATAGELRALRPTGAAATANEFRLRAVEYDKLGNIRCTELGTMFGVLD